MNTNAVVVLDGTVRAREPEHTHQLLVPLLGRYGITRVARLTGLDCLNLPVATAIRPAARTLAASQGKGATDLLAWLSAVMEAIELWHVEQPQTVVLHASAADARPPYPLTALPLRVHHEALNHLPIDWVAGQTVADAEPALLPADLLRRNADPLRPHVLRATSTGLAAGNTWAEAALHGMYEVVERDALHADDQEGGRRRVRVDPDTVTDPYCRSLLERLLRARAAVEVYTVANAYQLPVCCAFVWSEEYPRWFGGAGCHADPHIALSRAITEAAQSRLTSIAGTRCDLPSTPDPAFALNRPRPQAPIGARPWGTATAGFDRTPQHIGLDAQAHTLAARIEQVTGYPPIAVTLSDPAEPVTVLQIVCPGARSRTRRSLAR
ncbi:YcaO-like family protein [Kitasatospora aburaviensis]|uniref:YcaO-like family protein n=1 Tax=Kitasatospora aburaviensis TaxID=67265 RepID=A0ABW1F8N3_9ACTN